MATYCSSWRKLTPATMGKAAMLGVVCPKQSALSDQGIQGCLTSLKQAFKAEGGSYSGS